MKFGRRAFLQGSAGLMIAARMPAAGAADPDAVVLDFSAGLPAGTGYYRGSPALRRNGEAFELCAPDEPRIELAGPAGQPALLLEGSARRVLEGMPGEPGETGPDGTSPALVESPELATDDVVARIPPGERDRMMTASVFVRAPERTRWEFAIRSPYNNEITLSATDVGPVWQRLSVSHPSYVAETDPIDVFIHRAKVEGGSTEKPSLFWGLQVEEGWQPSSPVPPGERAREDDELTVGGHIFKRPAATVRLHLPSGGRRAGTLLDAESGNFALGYNNSGFLQARIGKIEVVTAEEVTADTIVELAWSAAGVAIATGSANEVRPRAFAAGDPGIPDCGATVRLLARHDGSLAANTHIARLEVSGFAGPSTAVALPSYVPSAYRLAFADEFDDPDTGRINEDGVWTKGGPFWRSRYRWSRFDVINKEKQIYMDRAFAGTGDKPLGVDPFSIENGILTITAARADPTGVRPFLKDAGFTSGLISSAQSHSQLYGYFEIRCRAPAGRGFWPAFWLLPPSESSPPEIDILEASGARRFSVSTATHAGEPDKPAFYQAWRHDKGDVTDSFHTYSLEWTESDIVMFMDGVEIRRGPNFITVPMFMVVNLAVGSHEEKWIPDPDETTPLPGKFEIDFIRCWQRG